MGVVTNCIFTFSICEEETKIDEVNSFFVNSKGLVSIDDSSLPCGWYGGTRAMEAPLFLGAFNYFFESDFIAHVKKIKWKVPEEVQLILKRDEDDRFSIIDIFV